MTRTLTETDAMKLTLPALPGLLARSCPVRVRVGPDAVVSGVCVIGGVVAVRDGGLADIYEVGDGELYDVAEADVTLDLSHHAGRARVAQWLAEGQKCPDCDGGWIDGKNADSGGKSTRYGCPNCGGKPVGGNDGPRFSGRQGTGYLRQPSPVWHFLDGPGEVEPWLSAALLWISAIRVSKGMGPILEIGGEWVHTHGENYVRITAENSDVVSVSARGWRLYNGERPLRKAAESGPETGDEGKAKADEAALVKGYALLDTAEKLRVEVPDSTPSPLEK